jgi:type IV fimbrial biogenesis protein FimT
MRRKAAGFTLIELMVIIGLIVILAAIAVPSYIHMSASNGVVAAVNDLASAFSHARSEAIDRGVQVTVCPSQSPYAKSPTCGGDWTDGWFAFVDPGNPPGTYQSDDPILRVHGPIGKGIVLSNISYIAFNRVGFAQPTFSGTTDTSVAIVACPKDRRPAGVRAVIVDRSGNISTAASKAVKDKGYTCP